MLDGTFLCLVHQKDSYSREPQEFVYQQGTTGPAKISCGQRRATRMILRVGDNITQLMTQQIRANDEICIRRGNPMGAGRHLPSMPWALELREMYLGRL